MIEVRVSAEDLDPLAEMAQLMALRQASIGALATFCGLMRDHNDGLRVDSMQLEHYPGMTEKSLRWIAEEASRRWPLLLVRIVHRFGLLRPADPIVFVAVGSAQRRAAFAACEFIMDHLKTAAPFWKKEESAGASRWVEARSEDLEAVRRWQE